MSENDSIALAFCPFCGATDMLQTDKMAQEYDETSTELSLDAEPDAELGDEWFVVCGDCGAMGPMSPSCEQAQAAWNRRA